MDGEYEPMRRIDAGWRKQQQILKAREAAMVAVIDREGNASGAFEDVAKALLPLCRGAWLQRQQIETFHTRGRE